MEQHEQLDLLDLLEDSIYYVDEDDYDDSALIEWLEKTRPLKK